MGTNDLVNKSYISIHNTVYTNFATELAIIKFVSNEGTGCKSKTETHTS